MSTEVKTPETLEEAQALLQAEREAKEKALERAIGAEKVIENHKKNDKKEPNDTPSTFSKEDVEKMLADRDLQAKENEFFAKNPDMVEYKDKIAEYTSKGISIQDAKMLLEKNDPTIANRKNANKSNFTSGDSGVQAKTITQEEMSKLSPEEFKRMWQMKEKGEVKVV